MISSSRKLKIVIASTPKTGNTWVRHLLSAIYELPMAELPVQFDEATVDALGDRWVGQQHYFPRPHLLEWTRERGAVLVTTIRHPGDILVSLYHFIRDKPYDPTADVGSANMMELDREQMGSHTLHFVETDLAAGLYMSLDWMRSGLSLIVRYEDLWRDPSSVLTKLTSQIKPVSQDRIERAIDLCDINMLRAQYDPDGRSRFYRTGRVGDWRQMPGEIVQAFRECEPYPSLFAAMGYTMDPNDALIAEPAKPRISLNSFRGDNTFSNGVPASPIIVKRYLSTPYCAWRWPRPRETQGKDSFFTWLNLPADADPASRLNPRITNIAAYVHQQRADVAQIYPDIYGQNRADFASWFASNAAREYQLHDAFIAPVYSTTAEANNG